MSVTPAEISGPVSQQRLDAPASEAGSTGSDSEKTSSVNKVSVMHGLILSGIELALTIANAVNQDAFKLNSFSDVIFGGSVVIEAVGFVFAIVMTVRALTRPVDKGVVGVGVPAMVFAEIVFTPESERDMMNDYWEFVIDGLRAQSLCVLVFTVVSWVTSPDSLPMISIAMWVFMAVAFAALLYAGYRRMLDWGAIAFVSFTVFVSVPFAVEISESTLLFKSDSIPFVGYLLAVLDLVIIASAAIFCFLLVSVSVSEAVDRCN